MYLKYSLVLFPLNVNMTLPRNRKKTTSLIYTGTQLSVAFMLSV